MTELTRSVERLSENEDFLALFPSYGAENCICGTVTPHPKCPDHFAIAALERLEDENDAAHSALDHFDVPRTEPHFKSPYMLSGRIRWLRSHLVIEGNQRAAKLLDEIRELEEAST